MKKSVGYYFLVCITWPMILFPLKFHYIISDILYFITYHIIGYRKTVVRQNLDNAFPEKVLDEKRTIERKVYRNFTDMFIETLYLAHMKKDKRDKIVQLGNIEVLNDLIDRGRNIIAVTGHLMNWELLSLFVDKVGKAKVFFVYKMLNNPLFDQFYIRIRSKGGAFPLEMKKTFRTLVTESKKGTQYIALFIGDQRPLPNELNFWMPFLNQETPVLLGTEKIAKKTKASVVYFELLKPARGKYVVNFKLVSEDPMNTDEFEITRKHMNYLEETIRKYPWSWLWTHKRWKYKRN